MCLRKLALTLAMAILISLTLFPLYAKSYEQPTQEFVKNCSFEVRDYGPPWPCGGVYSCPPWETNKGGWREEPADINGNGLVEGLDYGIFSDAWGSHGPDIPNPGDPPSDNWNPDCDFNGNGYVEGLDYGIFGEHWGHTANRMDGAYSWFTSEGGNYTMWQWLDNDYVQTVAGQTVMFSFQFYPESVASNGSQNNARAGIYYEYSGGNNTVYGDLVAPKDLNWWNASVTASLPSTTAVVKVIIHGKPDFKAWIDLASLTIRYYYWGFLRDGKYKNAVSAIQVGDKIAARFTAPENCTVNRASCDLAVMCEDGKVRVGVQSDNNGEPSGTWLGENNKAYVDVEPIDRFKLLNSTFIENASLTQGTVYHMVVEVLNASASDGAKIYVYTPAHYRRSKDNSYDPNMAALWNGGSGWMQKNGDPSACVITTDCSNAFPIAYWDILPRRFTGSYSVKQHIEPSQDVPVEGLIFPLGRMGTPTKNMIIKLKNIADNITLEQKTIIPNDVIEWEYRKYESPPCYTWNFTESHMLYSDKIYEIELDPNGNGDADNCFVIAEMWMSDNDYTKAGSWEGADTYLIHGLNEKHAQDLIYQFFWS